ncbi:MAG TPA: hypothetical protein PLK30_19585 [Blastocatellia bacterium]|nr:hypothetical protein [Blastocatellia bacterium]
MASISCEGMETVVRKAKALRTAWLLEREERRVKQLDANVEVRRVWIDSDSMWATLNPLERFAIVHAAVA